MKILTNGVVKMVCFRHKTSDNTRAKIYAMEIKKENNTYELGYRLKTKLKWAVTATGVNSDGKIYFPSTLANIDSDSRNELVTGVRNGMVYAYDNDPTLYSTSFYTYHMTILKKDILIKRENGD